jgi:hypothetical protein
MPTFTIDTENNVTVFGSLQEIPENGEGTEIFSSAEELTDLARKWPGARLVEIWNSLPGVEPVQRFTSRKTAVMRIWKAIQKLQPGSGADSRQGGGKKARARKKASRNRPPVVSKTARVIALLRQPTGASLKTIMRATGWQAHSVRGFISGQLGKKLGLRVHSIARDGERVYAIKS